MQFFRMKQDRTMPYSIKMENFDITKDGHIFKKEDYEKINETTVLFLLGQGDEAKPDFLQSPVMMISDTLKNIFDVYEDDLLFRSVVMIHRVMKVQYRYHMILMEELEVKSEESEYYPDCSEKRLILDAKKIGNHHIFRLKDSRIREPFVSLAVAESILRRNVTGIIFEEVEVR